MAGSCSVAADSGHGESDANCSPAKEARHRYQPGPWQHSFVVSAVATHIECILNILRVLSLHVGGAGGSVTKGRAESALVDAITTIDVYHFQFVPLAYCRCCRCMRAPAAVR